MRLKKIASVIAAVAMAATLCMPAFAEATPGEIANSAAEQAAASQDIGEIGSYVEQATQSLKTSTEPVTSPGMLRGSTTWRDVPSFVAPRLPAARFRSSGMFSMTPIRDRIISGRNN